MTFFIKLLQVADRNKFPCPSCRTTIAPLASEAKTAIMDSATFSPLAGCFDTTDLSRPVFTLNRVIHVYIALSRAIDMSIIKTKICIQLMCIECLTSSVDRKLISYSFSIDLIHRCLSFTPVQ